MRSDSRAATLQSTPAENPASGADRPTGFRAWRSLRERWVTGVACPSTVAFAFAVAFLWSTLYSLPFWRQTVAAMWHPGGRAALFMATLLVVAVTVQATMLLLLPSRLLRGAASLLFVIAAVSWYFSGAYGAIMNKDMIRNALETDAAEVRNLLSVGLFAYAFFFGLIPAILVWRVKLPATRFFPQLRQRALALGVAWALSVAGLFAASANYAVFFREHKPIRYTLAPVAPVSSTLQLAGDLTKRRHTGPLLNPGGQVTRVGAAGQQRPLVIFLVIGETARAANFELGGYPRQTNRELKGQEGLVYFDAAMACGTATATSVPCMFSLFDREHFDVDQADRYMNLLDTLVSGGFDVQWRDNSAGCKGVCARIPTLSYAQQPDPALCSQSYCYDEIMLRDLAEMTGQITRNTLIVFHQIGSHGPAYTERYPPQYEIFKPSCRSNELQRCTQEEVINAYDNTIAYSDHVLAGQIAALRAANDRVDSMLLYVSDHGESLGEGGAYLHGLPYAFAPDVQKHVPLFVWTSTSYRSRSGLDQGCLAGHAHDAVSHDNLYHTILGAAELRNDVYNPRLDLLNECRKPGAS